MNSVNSTFVVSIAKVEGVASIKGFHPISSVVVECQHAFVEGRQIMVMVFVTNELLDDQLFRKRDGVLCKFDMEEAYDHVNEDFIDYMLMRVGFGDK